MHGDVWIGKGHLVTSNLEHAAVYETAHNLIKQGWTATFLECGPYGAPTPEQVERYAKIRHSAAVLVHTIMDNAPICADRLAAIRKVREAVMTANAAIALRGQSVG